MKYWKGVKLWAVTWWEFFKQPPTGPGLITECLELAKQEAAARKIAEAALALERALHQEAQEHHKRLLLLLARNPDQAVRDAVMVAEMIIAGVTN